MNTRRWLIAWMVILTMVGLAACAQQPAAPAPAEASAETQAPAPTAEQPAAPAETTAPAAEPTTPEAGEPTGDFAGVPADVPIYPNPLDLSVDATGTSISYQAENQTVQVLTEFYQAELKALGWEQKNKKDSGFGDSITILRSKPDHNISVTLQSIAGSGNVRVLITILKK
jgi:hypothetical protein